MIVTTTGFSERSFDIGFIEVDQKANSIQPYNNGFVKIRFRYYVVTIYINVIPGTGVTSMDCSLSARPKNERFNWKAARTAHRGKLVKLY
jgi:hypothetical protein